MAIETSAVRQAPCRPAVTFSVSHYVECVSMLTKLIEVYLSSSEATSEILRVTFLSS
jgi:hypothetical protein